MRSANRGPSESGVRRPGLRGDASTRGGRRLSIDGDATGFRWHCSFGVVPGALGITRGASLLGVAASWSMSSNASSTACERASIVSWYCLSMCALTLSLADSSGALLERSCKARAGIVAAQTLAVKLDFRVCPPTRIHSNFVDCRHRAKFRYANLSSADEVVGVQAASYSR